MNKLVDVLEPKEKRALAILALVLCGLVLFLVFGSLRERGRSVRLRGDLSQAERSFNRQDQERNAVKAEWQSWQDAGRDLKKLRKGHFYQAEEGIQRLRLDIQDLLGRVRLNVSDMKFDYLDLQRERARKVTASFTFSGTYAVLRRFLYGVEAFPKLLLVERIQFVSIDVDSGDLQLKISLAAYYAM